MFRRDAALMSLLSALLVGCGGGLLASTVTANSMRPAPDVYECVRAQLKSVGFSRTSYDQDEQRISAQKVDEHARRPDVTFRRLLDRLTIDVQPASGGTAITTLAVQATTFVERVTQRGPTEDQERASETARRAAQTLVDRCSKK